MYTIEIPNSKTSHQQINETRLNEFDTKANIQIKPKTAKCMSTRDHFLLGISTNM